MPFIPGSGARPTRALSAGKDTQRCLLTRGSVAQLIKCRVDLYFACRSVRVLVGVPRNKKEKLDRFVREAYPINY